MPTFKLNKLIRDNLKDIYIDTNQKAKYRKLKSKEHKQELIRKIIEEASEINADSSAIEITDEIADIRQVLDDLMSLCGITEEQVQMVQRNIFDKKGGFAQGTFVETLKLKDDDKWAEYYRKKPDVFPEEQ